MPRRNWNVRKDKTDAILDVLRHILANPADGNACVGKGGPPFNQDVNAHALFNNPQIGNIDIPADGRIVVFANGELDLQEKGSIILELPPNPWPGPSKYAKLANGPSDTDLLSFALGNYKYW